MEKSRFARGTKRKILHEATVDLQRNLAREPLTSGLYVVSIGSFPHFREDHRGRNRPQESKEHILVYCRDGRGWIEIDGRGQKVLPGEVILIPRESLTATGQAMRSRGPPDGSFPGRGSGGV